ncbi:MAG: hypothetical protein PHV87_04425, partial [Bacilli bacterium]|nr:hypothetical protein [Bacilli bacterium]
DSCRMIEEELAMGVENIILTPHVLRVGMPRLTKQEYLNFFISFKTEIQKNYKVNLYLGQEIAYHPQIIKYLQDDQLLTKNNTPYLLLELPFFEPIKDYDELFYSCAVLNYKIIIAHIERYHYLTYSDVLSFKKYPILYQINSNSLTGESGRKLKKLSFRMIKDGLVDLVGSDVHACRTNDLALAYQTVALNFSDDEAKRLFIHNPRKLFDIK